MSTSKETVERILALSREGRSSGKIAKELGMSKSTVADIIKRESKRADESDDSPARTRASKSGPPVQSDPSEKPSEFPSEKSDAVRPLTRDEAVSNIRTYLNVAKRGYLEARKDKGLAADKRTWQETQYLKLYRDGIRMLIECTGLDKPEPEVRTTSPLDELAKVIESYREDE